MSSYKRRRTPRRFAMIPLQVFESDAVRSLSHATFRVLLLIAARFNGHNNGALGVTAAQARDAGVSRNTLYAALRSLEDRGLIERTEPPSRVPPRPTMYSLAWLARDETEHCRKTRVASNTYKEWRAAA